MGNNDLTSPWTEELIAFVREKAVAGRSADAISKALGERGYRLSRNSVIGICKRRGINLRGGNGGRAVGTRPQKQKSLPATHSRPPMTDQERLAGLIAIAKAAPPPDGELLPSSRPATLIELRDSDCRWPLGRDGSERRLFCCAPKMVGCYCLTHYVMSVELKRTEKSRAF